MPLASMRYSLRILLVSSLFVVLALPSTCEAQGAAFFWGFNDTVRL